MNVFVALYRHAYGCEVCAFGRIAEAEEWRQEIAKEWWDKEVPEEDMPADPAEAADRYFEVVAFESFRVHEVELGS